MGAEYTRRDDGADWKRLVMSRLSLMRETHGAQDKACAGIDLRLSAPFVRRDLLHAHEVLDMRDESGDIVGFAFIKTNWAALYVCLLVSLKPGVGSSIVYELQQTSRFVHSKIAVRSTDAALGFYLKLNFRLFDWSGVEADYVGEGDEELTRLLRGGAAKETRAELCRRMWLNDGEEEWPLLTVRRAALNRSSARIRSRYESSLLPAPKAAGRTS